MGIYREYQYVASCEKCGDIYPEAAFTKAEFVKDMRKLGWCIGKRVLCPVCKEVTND